MAGESRTTEPALYHNGLSFPPAHNEACTTALGTAMGFFCMPSHLSRRPLPTLPEKSRWFQAHLYTAITASSPPALCWPAPSVAGEALRCLSSLVCECCKLQKPHVRYLI